MKKKEVVLKNILEASKLYDKNLNNKNLLIIYKIGENIFSFFEVVFLPRNFFHLTGVKETKVSSVEFFEKCLLNDVSLSDFELAEDGTTYMKSNIIIECMSIYQHAKMVGEYNNSKPRLYTKTLAGGVRCCMGFTKDDEMKDYLVPNTLLEQDIRDVIVKSHQIIAIFQKNIKSPLYDNLLYIQKKYSKTDVLIKLNKDVLDKIDNTLLKN